MIGLADMNNISEADLWRLEEARDALLAGDPHDVQYALAILRLLERPTAYSLEASRLAWGGHLDAAAACCQVAAGRRA